MDILTEAGSTLFVGAAVWLGMLFLLVTFTFSVSKMLSYIFFAVGLILPITMLHNANTVMAAHAPCSVEVHQSGSSVNDRYSFSLIERRCSGDATSEFALRTGLSNELSPHQEVLVMDRKPTSVQANQSDENEFIVVMAPDAETETAVYPFRVRLDPATGRATDKMEIRLAQNQF